MFNAPEKTRGVSLVTTPARPKEPGETRITLSVCGCFKHDRLTLITERARRVATILGITSVELECFAVTAMLTGKAEVVACYKQRDVAEEKLMQLEGQSPFISRPCHSFGIQSET